MYSYILRVETKNSRKSDPIRIRTEVNAGKVRCARPLHYRVERK